MPKKDFSSDATDIFGLEERKKEEDKLTFVEKPEEPFILKLPKEKNEKMTTKTFRITHMQHKALKLRVALSENPDEKDISAIVRNALDLYLAEK